MYAEDLVQAHEGSVIVDSVSVRPSEPCLVGSVGCVLPVSSTRWLLQSFLSPCGGAHQAPPNSREACSFLK